MPATHRGKHVPNISDALDTIKVLRCDILALGDDDILVQGLIKLIEYSYNKVHLLFWNPISKETPS
jgi:hypothetical protein